MPKFTHLHVHSHYSLLDGLPKIDELLDYVQELGMDSVALTDHGVLYGAVEFYKKAKARGLKPIIGSELYVALEHRHQRRPHIDDKRHHLVLLVKDETGYRNLIQLVTQAHLEGFYYKPRVDEELLAKHGKGLICLSACLQGKIPKLILAGKIQEAEQTALKYQSIFGPGNFYLELQDHPNLAEQKKANQGIIALARKTGIPLIATQDSHYLKSEDAQAQDILMLINTGADKNDPERLTMKGDDFSLKSPQIMIESFKKVPEAIENTQKIVENCSFELELGQTKLPSFPLPKGEKTNSYLRKLCLEGLKKRVAAIDKPMQERLDYELEMIEKTGFASYFLIVQDFVNWAKEQKIVVGPGRGSVAGSLVAYALNITDINPLKYDLIFERFLSLGRISMPDIDLDFTDTRRDEVIEYVAQKYGRDRVAQIITFGTMASRAVIRDVGRALGYSYGYCDQIAKLIPMYFSLDKTLKRVAEFRNVYQTDEQAKTLIDLAKKLEGVARHASTHACGVVIAAEPLSDIVPLQHPTQNDRAIVTQYEMHSVEDIGLLKMDFLGLRNLTIIENALKLIKKLRQQEIDLAQIPYDDEKTYQLLQKAEVIGIFQLESGGMRRYLQQLKPTGFEDIMAMIALYRPGPMELIPQYISRKHHREKIEYLHPKLEPILKNTYGIGIYQEQMMQIARDLAGYSLSEADTLRKAIGKKIKSLLDEQQEKLTSGMIKNGIDQVIAEKIWQLFPPFARYGFNRAHTASYATIAYQTAYLKTHFPIEFMTAVLSAEKQDLERTAFLIDECRKIKIDVLAPSINESFENFTVTSENQIRFGLLAIKNVGHNVVKAIVEERKRKGFFSSLTDFISRLQPKDLNKKSLESLIKSGALDALGERNQLLQNLGRILESARELQKQKADGQRGLFDASNHVNPVSLVLKSVEPASKKEKLRWEKELLGLYVTSHPLEDFKALLEAKVAPITEVAAELLGQRVKIGGMISRIKRIITRSGKPMLFITLEDQTDKIEVIAFPNVVERNAELFQEDKIVFVAGRVDGRNGAPKLICEEIEEIVEE